MTSITTINIKPAQKRHVKVTNSTNIKSDTRRYSVKSDTRGNSVLLFRGRARVERMR